MTTTSPTNTCSQKKQRIEKRRSAHLPDFSDRRTPITQEGERPQKRFYRQRAHCNPLAHNDTYNYPVSPSEMPWNHYQENFSNDPTDHHLEEDEEPDKAGQPRVDDATTTASNSIAGWLYPETLRGRAPTVLDIGCGFGGLTMTLARLLPEEIILGMEIRAKVTEYVRLRILAARQRGYDNNQNDTKNEPNQHPHHHHHDYANCAVLRTNSMKFLPNYFAKASIHKLFFCFPDPHFKRKNHPRRIISVRLLSEYAYVLKPNIGKLYCITDVKELHDWHVKHCDAHPLFRRVVVSHDGNNTENDVHASAVDPCIEAMKNTEEGQKVDRKQGQKYYAVYQRIADEEQLQNDPIHAGNFFNSMKEKGME
jgi:tRNA (guanine-N7-)-methyltransferase